MMQAIKLFADARPPGIYKPDYIDALYKFYHERKPEMVVCPPTPEWKRSSDLDLNGDAVPDEDDDGVPVAPLPVCIYGIYYFFSLTSFHTFLGIFNVMEMHTSMEKVLLFMFVALYNL